MRLVVFESLCLGNVYFFIGGSASGEEKMSQIEQQIREGEERARKNVIIIEGGVEGGISGDSIL